MPSTISSWVPIVDTTMQLRPQDGWFDVYLKRYNELLKLKPKSEVEFNMEIDMKHPIIGYEGPGSPKPVEMGSIKVEILGPSMSWLKDNLFKFLKDLKKSSDTEKDRLTVWPESEYIQL